MLSPKPPGSLPNPGQADDSRWTHKDAQQHAVRQPPYVVNVQPAGNKLVSGDPMPRAPRKCSWSGCENRITHTRYCTDHTVHGWTGRSHATGAQHQAWRTAVLKRDKGMCQLKLTGCTHRATQADHIINVKAGGGQYDVDNGQGACEPCHKQKTQQESIDARRKIRRIPKPE